MTNFIEAQEVLRELSKQHDELLMTSVKERIGEGIPVDRGYRTVHPHNVLHSQSRNQG